MKKVIMLAALVAALASCQSKANKMAEAQADSLATEAMTPLTDNTEVFEGVLPVAGGPGIRYVLALNMLADASDTIYTLDMTYLDADGKGKHKTLTSTGKPEVIHKTVKGTKKAAMKLNPADGSQPTYFVIANDTTLTLVDGNLEEQASDASYDLVKVK